MTRVKLRAYNPVEVELFGHLFESVDLSQSKAKRIGEIEAEMQGVTEDEADEKMQSFLWEWFDLVLTQADDGKQKPSTVLKAKWKSEELTPRQLLGLWLDIQFGIAEVNKGPEADVDPAAASTARPT